MTTDGYGFHNEPRRRSGHPGGVPSGVSNRPRRRACARGRGHRVMVSETTPVVLAEGHKHTMAPDQSALLEVLGGDPARRDTDRFGRLGRVLGQVRRDRDIGDLPAAGEADDAGIDLVAPR